MTTKTDQVLQDLVAEHNPVPYELPDVHEEQANAYWMLGAFRETARVVGWPDDAISLVITLAVSSDYDHLRHVLAAVCWEAE